MADQKTAPLNTLATYRKEIDAIDDELVSLIIKRSNIVTNVKTLKDATWPKSCHIRAGRESAMHADLFARFAATPLGAQAGAELWRMLISASTMIESSLNIGILPSTETDAKCYFSLLANYSAATDMNHISQLFTSDEIDIACLPYPSTTTLAESLVTLMKTHTDLQIFAYAPVVLKQGSIPPFIMVGRIEVEMSGNDWSYFLLDSNAEISSTDTLCASSKQGQIIRVNGYHITHPNHSNARFLGAHGAPLCNHSPPGKTR